MGWLQKYEKGGELSQEELNKKIKEYRNSPEWYDNASGRADVTMAPHEYLMALPENAVADAVFGLGSKIASPFIKKVVPEAAETVSKVFSKVISKNKKNIPSSISEEGLDFSLKKNIEWINSPEYIKRRSASTGETAEQIKKWVTNKNKTFLNANINFGNSFMLPKDSKGVFRPNILGVIPDNIHIRNNSMGSMLGTLDHETAHALSATNPFTSLYKNYPKIPIEGSTEPNIIKKFLQKHSNSDEAYANYLNDPMEQQVRLNKWNKKIRKDLNITDPQLSKEQFENWTSNHYEELSKPYYSDIQSLINWRKKGTSKDDFLNTLNKAWGIAPTVIGINALSEKKEGGEITTSGKVRDFLHKTVGVPMAINQLGYDVSGGQSPITENSLTDEELNYLRGIVRKNLKSGKDVITYGDYTDKEKDTSDWKNSIKAMGDAPTNLQYTLGRAKINVNKGDTTIVDRYNFNEDANYDFLLKGNKNIPSIQELTPEGSKKSKTLSNYIKSVKEIGLNDPYNQARNIGTYFGSDEQHGSPVKIKINQKANGGELKKLDQLTNFNQFGQDKKWLKQYK